MEAEQVYKDIVARMENSSKEYNGNDKINYPFLTGSLEELLKAVLRELPPERLEELHKTHAK